jgi:hypothetical protein
MTHTAAPIAPALRVEFRMRDLEVTIEADSAETGAQFGHLVNLADEVMPPARHVRFQVAHQAGQVALAEDDGAPRLLPDVNAALVAVHRRLATHLFALYERFTVLHSGAATINGKLLLFTGDRGAGKSTLLLKLALDGALFHCDEHVMARNDGLVHTLPRRLHVKPGTLTCLPQIAPACLAHPLLWLDGGIAFYPLDLAELGLRWRSADGRPAALIHLTPAFNWPPSLEPIAQIDMVKRLFVQASISNLEFGRQAADICGLVRGLPCYALRVGGLDETADLVRTLA